MQNPMRRGALLGHLLAGFSLMSRDMLPRFEGTVVKYPARTKPKQGKRNPFRGYYARYSNVLSTWTADNNRRLQNNATARNAAKRARKAGK